MVKPVASVADAVGNFRRSARLKEKKGKIAEDADKENVGSRANERKVEPPKRQATPRKLQPKAKKLKKNPVDPEGEIELATYDQGSQVPRRSGWKDALKWLQSRRDVGMCIQCCRENCGKWRYNADINDPTDVPEIWCCDMNSDRRFASCDYPDEELPAGTLEDMIENKYNAGSVVWARLEGYPWWPAMVDDCPFTFRYYDTRSNSNVPVAYNVIFFNEDKVEISWIPAKNIQPYKSNPKDVFLKRKKMKYRGVSYKNQVDRACEIADRATRLPLRERLEKFSFVALWPHDSRMTSADGQANSRKQKSTRIPKQPGENSTSVSQRSQNSGDQANGENSTMTSQPKSTRRSKQPERNSRSGSQRSRNSGAQEDDGNSTMTSQPKSTRRSKQLERNSRSGSQRSRNSGAEEDDGNSLLTSQPRNSRSSGSNPTIGSQGYKSFSSRVNDGNSPVPFSRKSPMTPRLSGGNTTIADRDSAIDIDEGDSVLDYFAGLPASKPQQLLEKRRPIKVTATDDSRCSSASSSRVSGRRQHIPEHKRRVLQQYVDELHETMLNEEKQRLQRSTGKFSQIPPSPRVEKNPLDIFTPPSPSSSMSYRKYREYESSLTRESSTLTNDEHQLSLEELKRKTRELKRRYFELYN